MALQHNTLNKNHQRALSIAIAPLGGGEDRPVPVSWLIDVFRENTTKILPAEESECIPKTHTLVVNQSTQYLSTPEYHVFAAQNGSEPSVWFVISVAWVLCVLHTGCVRSIKHTTHVTSSLTATFYWVSTSSRHISTSLNVQWDKQGWDFSFSMQYFLYSIYCLSSSFCRIFHFSVFKDKKM